VKRVTFCYLLFVGFDSAVREETSDDSRVQGENSVVDKGVL
jgi:hypothetical protein